MARHFFLILISLISVVCHRQFTQAEIEAMQKKLQKMKDSLMNDPRLKKMMDPIRIYKPK